ncbi:hypothetical protein HZS61_003229 [Fusarium oxysporum f. sp. conglutinans]|uniref:Uncharacterized protein n=1 Tax=Fusarium oxysporum f. sp. conglutinans TaxID=100902 RepID=A0A8H6LFT6_FUSOX|nr:hypothetical protein HZS61_003229 [Fusarium oxysporum f. sp. conglutinans]
MPTSTAGTPTPVGAASYAKTRDPSVTLFVDQHGWFRMYFLAMENRRSIVSIIYPTHKPEPPLTGGHNSLL